MEVTRPRSGTRPAGRALSGLAAAALVVWIASGAVAWKGHPWEHRGGAVVTLALGALAIGVVVAVLRLALRAPEWSQLWRATAALTAVRLAVSSTFPVLDDGAYGWLWSRKLELAYADHPGLVAWLSRLVVPWDAATAAAVRAAPVLFAAGMPLASYGLLRDVGCERADAARAGLLVLLLPGLQWSLFLTPHLYLWQLTLLALWMGWRALTRDHWRDWIAVGLAVGAALNCNFMSVLLGLSLLTYLLITADRRQLARARAWVAMGLVVLAAVPLVVWNARHDWVTFEFNLAGRHDAWSFEPIWLVAFVLQLALIASPAVVVWGLRGVPAAMRRGLRQGERATLLLACAVVVPVVVLAAATSLVDPHIVYSGQAAVPLALLFVLATRGQLGWYRAAVLGAAGLTAASFAAPAALAFTPRETVLAATPPRHRGYVEAHYAWSALAAYLEERGRFGRDTPEVLVAATYGSASQLCYHGRTVEFAYCYNPTKTPYGRQFEQWADLSDLTPGRDALLLFIAEPWAESALVDLRTAFVEIERITPEDPELEPFQLYRARHWRGWP